MNINSLQQAIRERDEARAHVAQVRQVRAVLTQPVWTGAKHSMSAATIMRGDAMSAVSMIDAFLARIDKAGA